MSDVDVVRWVVRAYLRKNPEAAHAYRYDARYHAEMTALRYTLNAVDAVMTAEGLTEPARVRILAATLAQTAPSSASALARQQQAESAAARAAELSMTGPWPPNRQEPV